MIYEISDTRLTLSSEPLPFEMRNKSRIDIFWDQAFETNPRLWNGPFFMFQDVSIKDGVLIATGYRTDFATFLYWRDSGRPADTIHITGTSFPVLNDGSLLAVKMMKHTATAGRIYFPAGSFDRSDIVDGCLDPQTNFTRELEEEVGITLKPEWLVGPQIACFVDNSYHVTQKAHVPYSFDAVEKTWQRHAKNGGDDEIEALVQIGSTMHIPEQMPAYARELCKYHFDLRAYR